MTLQTWSPTPMLRSVGRVKGCCDLETEQTNRSYKTQATRGLHDCCKICVARHCAVTNRGTFRLCAASGSMRRGGPGASMTRQTCSQCLRALRRLPSAHSSASAGHSGSQRLPRWLDSGAICTGNAWACKLVQWVFAPAFMMHADPGASDTSTAAAVSFSGPNFHSQPVISRAQKHKLSDCRVPRYLSGGLSQELPACCY